MTSGVGAMDCDPMRVARSDPGPTGSAHTCTGMPADRLARPGRSAQTVSMSTLTVLPSIWKLFPATSIESIAPRIWAMEVTRLAVPLVKVASTGPVTTTVNPICNCVVSRRSSTAWSVS